MILFLLPLLPLSLFMAMFVLLLTVVGFGVWFDNFKEKIRG